MTHPSPLATREPSRATTGETPQWTLERMDAFIRTLQRTQSVAAAARAAGMSRQAAYKLRARLRGHPFDQAWEAAVAPRARLRRMLCEHGAGVGVTGGDTR